MSVTELWLARHGQTNWNLEGRYQGHSDEPLNENGLAQAVALAESVEGHRVQAIYSSDLQRAFTTAQAVGDRFGIEVHADPRLREVSLGRWEGMLFHDIRTQDVEHFTARQENPLYARPPGGGESVYDLAARVWPAVDELAARHAPGPVLIVSHGLVLATLLCRARGIPLTEAFQNIPPNAVLTIIEWATSSEDLSALAPERGSASVSAPNR
jgi:2,3-bisphosphoglycerate-dependent phosphoglycerate mutase